MTTRFRILGLLALGALAFGSARAQVSVQANVTNNGPAYHYEYTVNNQTGTDLSSVTLAGLPAGESTVQNLAAPATFVAFFDSGLGLLTFQEGSGSFTAGGMFSGFSFDSLFAPGAVSFSAIDVNGSELTGVSVSAVPEPSTYALIGAIAALGFVVYRKRRALPVVSNS